MAKAGGQLARRLEVIPSMADEWSSAVARDGAQGLRAALKLFVQELRERLAADMTASCGANDE
jgi:hypothetical protein